MDGLNFSDYWSADEADACTRWDEIAADVAGEETWPAFPEAAAAAEAAGEEIPF